MEFSSKSIPGRIFEVSQLSVVIPVVLLQVNTNNPELEKLLTNEF